MSFLKVLFWGVYLGILAGLSACSEPQNGVQNFKATPVSPFDAKSLGLQNLLSFDLYVDKQNLHAAFIATAADSKQIFIGYLHSEDGGLHWSAPINLQPQFPLPLESKAGNDIQIAAAGEKLMLVWQLTGELPGMGPLLTVHSEDAGKTWQQGSNPTGGGADQSHHDLAVDSAGRFHLVWLDDRDENGYQGVRYARSSNVGKDWELAQTLDESSCSCCWNRIAIAPDGGINVLYRDMEPRDMALAQSLDAGANWQRLSTVGEFNWVFNGCPHNGGGLSYADDKSLHAVVWTGAENRVGLYHLQSLDGGKIWTEPQAVAPGTAAFHADIASRAGRLVIIWDALGPEGSRVFIAESGDNGASWSEARQLSTVGSAVFPRILATSSGLLVLWQEQLPGGGKQWSSVVLQ